MFPYTTTMSVFKKQMFSILDK